MQSYINSLKETEALISNLEIENFDINSQTQLLENNSLLYLLSQKTQALRSLKLKDLKNCDNLAIKESETEFELERVPFKFFEWHEDILQKLEIEFNVIYIKLMNRLKFQTQKTHSRLVLDF